MWIDVLFAITLLLAIFKGLSRGLVIAVFSALAFIIGLAAAIKLSASVAGYLKEHTHMSSRWLPILAFLIVFIGVILLVRWGAKLIEGMMDLAMMGWLNKLGGILLYALAYTVILSVLLFYAVQAHLVSQETLSASISYSFIKPWGPAVIEVFGKLIPLFKGMFAELEDFFGRLGSSLQST
jgi:membrane protein required for colicin V production